MCRGAMRRKSSAGRRRGAAALTAALALASVPAAADPTTLYGYDTLGRVTSATFPDGRRIAYAYDASGNRTQLAVGRTPDVFGRRHRQATRDGQPGEWHIAPEGVGPPALLPGRNRNPDAGGRARQDHRHHAVNGRCGRPLERPLTEREVRFVNHDVQAIA